MVSLYFFFSSRRRHTRFDCDWSSDVCSSDLGHQCNACGMRHCHIQIIPKGRYEGERVDEPEYEGWSGAGWTIGLTDKYSVSWLNTRIDRACVDVNEFGWVCGWVMEFFEEADPTEK